MTTGPPEVGGVAETKSTPTPSQASKEERRESDRARRGGPGRRILVWALVVLFSILAPITTAMAWTHRTVLDTPTYVDTVSSVGKDPAVIARLSQLVTDQIYLTLNPQQALANALPPKAAPLAAPIAAGAKGYVQQGVDKVLSSAQFQQLWVTANQFAHKQLVAVLRGDTKVVTETNGNVILNLVPLLAAAMTNLGQFASAVVGHPVTLPQVTGTELPAAACAQISSELGRPLPSTCGQVVLFRAKNLAQARRAVQAFDRGVLALLIITPLLAIGALLVTRRRRRTVLQLTIGAMLGLVIVRRLFFWLQDRLVHTGPSGGKEARTAIAQHVLGGFFDVTVWLLVAGLAVVLVAWVTGPYRYAVRVREASTDLWTAATKPREGVTDSSHVVFVRRHFDVLRIAGVVVAMLLLLAVNLSWVWFLAIAAVLVVYEVGLAQLRPPAVVTLPDTAGASVAPKPRTPRQ